ncbi:DUF3131 domain-containing protein [Palleronia sp. LCG004]|uniref:DUF3131 domain-containing protein n=1 Tax=Palleronia sp. LCG004 TaxID=3079304 RepID=UPI002941F4ED|nr:DUF3131 domain-containing protein [Palleronia sp. LCG004]WOI57433.1 DUF3131 domain-containing protein [Palleronia sp. LCG004]
MTFQENLIRARSHIVFLAALGVGLGLVLWLEGMGEQPMATVMIPDPTTRLEAVDPLPLAIVGESSERDLEHARIAWTYFENNVDEGTGLVNSANAYPSTTMWETGSYIVAILSAERLQLIDGEEAEARIGKVIDSLGKLRLFDGKLPNKAYHTRTLELVDYTNKPSETGLGWSALDVARIVAAMGLVERNHPGLAPEVEALLAGWDLDSMIVDGELMGTNIVAGEIRHNQEGRVGYEQYAAKGMMLFGYDAYRAYEVKENLMVRDVEGIPVPVDTRLHRGTLPAFTVSEPYLFDGLEFGFDARSSRFATAVYEAQEARYHETGTLTAVSESHLSEAPYFAYATIWGGGAPWSVLSFKGERMDSRRTIATKAAFGWNALFGTEYTDELIDALEIAADPEQGWAEGIYEATGELNSSVTANTNAVVLAALAFRASGPLIRSVR